MDGSLPEQRSQPLHEVVAAVGSLPDPSQLAELTVTEVKRLLGTDGASLMLWDPDLGVLVPLAYADEQVGEPMPVFFPGQGLIGEAFEQDAAKVVYDYQREIARPPAWATVRSGMSVPLHGDGRVLGALSTQTYYPREFTAEELNTLQSVAAQVGPTLDALRTLAQAQLRTAQAEALAQLMRRGAALQDADAVYALICDTAVRLVGAELVGLVLRDSTEERSSWRGVTGNRTDVWKQMYYGGEHPAAAAMFAGRLHFGRHAPGIADAATYPFFHAEEIKLGIGIPLDESDGSLGAMCLGWRFDADLADAQLQFTKALAGFAGTLVNSLRARSQRDALVRHAPVMLAAVDADLILTILEGAAAQAVGLGSQHVGQRVDQVLADEPEVLALLQRMREQPTGSRFVVSLRGRTLDASIVQHADGTMLVATDVTERLAAERELLRRATRDQLTGLANRTEMTRLMSAALADGPLSLVIADVRSFNHVNEAIGYEAANGLLCALAARLTGDLTDAIAVGHMGEDEFAVADVGDDPVALGVRVRASLEAFVGEDTGEAIAIDVNCGGASMPRGGDPAALLQQADAALQIARRSAAWIAVWDEDVATNRRERATLTGEIRRALVARDFAVVYQPIIDTRDRSVRGVEALARWRRPNGQPVEPETFVELTESIGRINQLTRQILDLALQEVAADLNLAVSVNVSALEVLDGTLELMLPGLLDKHNIDPTKLTLELTETAQLEAGSNSLERIAGRGVGIAIDDFGRGWSSVELLKRLPASKLKLDQSYVVLTPHTDRDAAIVRASVEIGHALGMEVVAEGVEDETVMDAISGLGCDLAQGFCLARPMGIEQLKNWLRSRQGA